MAKKKRITGSKPCNAYRCKVCGKVVPSIHRSRHLITAHKLDGTAIKNLFIDLGTTFKRNPNAKGIAMLREYQRNLNRPKNQSQYTCGSNPVEPKPFKLIYTPMGNKR